MTITATDFGYIARHAGGWYDPEHSRLDDYQPRHAGPSDDALLASIARLERDAANPMPCRRCDNAPDSPRTCAGCLDEISHAAETRRYEIAAGDHSTWGAL